MWRKKVTEILIALAVVVGLLVPALIAKSLAWSTTLIWAGALLGFGFTLGIPPAVVYHIKLRAALIEQEALDPKWYWNPMDQHKFLSDDQRDKLFLWLAMGGAGFLFVALGVACGVVAVLNLVGTI